MSEATHNLASLSKAATPQRLKDNATASKIITPPGKKVP